MRKEVANYIRSKENLLRTTDIDKLYSELGQGILPGELTDAFMEIGVDVLKYAQSVPTNFLWSSTSHYRKIDLPETITRIEDWAFAGSNIEHIMIPDSVVYIGEGAFFLCRHLTDIVFPNGQMIIPEGICSGCSSLSTVSMGDKVIGISPAAFSECISLGSIRFSKSLKVIGEGAFRNCQNLKLLLLPDGLSKIKVNAFAQCQSLTNVYLPNSITDIENNAFFGCGYMTIQYGGTMEEWKNLTNGKGIFTGGTTYTCRCTDGTLM